MTLPDLLDGSLRILKQAPGTVIGLAAVATLPVQLLLGILSRNSLEDTDFEQLFSDAFSGSGSTDLTGSLDGGTFAIGIVLQGLVLAWVAAGLAVLVTGWYTGRDRTLGEVAGLTARRIGPLVVAWVLVHLAEGVSLVGLLVGALVPMTFFAVVTPVLACEAVGPWRALRRSATLTRHRFGAVLGTCLAVVVVDMLLTTSLTGVASIYLATDLPAPWVVGTAVAAAAGLVITPFAAGVAVLLYLDLRVRVEGLDIQLAAAEQFVPSS
jgi:hypothetical protein